MESELLSIGRMARATGLTASALRFYDGAGVLVPVLVDPATGYRWYAERQVRAGRLIASLRRVGMPLADIGGVLRHWPAPEPVRRLLDAHVRRLEDGLTDARRELSRVDALLDSEEMTMTGTTAPITRVTVDRTDLASALRAVRFAAGSNPELPMLCGVLLDVDLDPGGPVLRLVATDRYRMAVSAVPLRGLAGAALSAIAPVRLIDEAIALLTARVEENEPGGDGFDGGGADGGGTGGRGAGSGGGGEEEAGADGAAGVTIGPTGIAFSLGGLRVSGPPVDQDFPDYRRLLRRDGGPGGQRQATVDVPALSASLAATEVTRMRRDDDGVDYDVSVLTVDERGELAVGARAASGAVGVNREFLLEALAAAGRDQLMLELDGPIRPLAVRVPGNERTFSIIMPTRLPETASHPSSPSFS